MSERTLAYTDENFSHKFLILYEAHGTGGDISQYLIRSLLSEGRISYEFVETSKEGSKTVLIEKEGPTGLITSTTAVNRHPENETRMFAISVADTRRQTKQILATAADKINDFTGGGVNFDGWHAFQDWLWSGEKRVSIPYAKEIAGLTKPVSIRIRRDFNAVLSLIKAHALVHQQNREKTKDGIIIANIDDYAAVRSLVAGLVAAAAEVEVSPIIREVVEAVAELEATLTDAPITYKRIADHIGLYKSSAARRASKACKLNYLVNVEDRKGRPANLRLGDPLPKEEPVFPRPEELTGCTPNATAQPSATACATAYSEQKQGVKSSGCTVARESGDKPDIYINTEKQFTRLCDQIQLLKEPIYIDTETTGLDPFKSNIRLFQIRSAGQNFIIDCPKILSSEPWESVRQILEDPKVIKIGQNLKFDIKILKKTIFDESLRISNCYDTFLAEKLLTNGKQVKPGGHSLKGLASKYCDIELSKEEQTSFTLTGDLKQSQIRYAALDVEVLEDIYKKQRPLLVKNGLTQVAALEFQLVNAIADTELAGIYFDVDKCAEIANGLKAKCDRYKKALNDLLPKGTTDVNFNSPKQLLKVFKPMGIDAESTSANVLKTIDHPFAKKLTKYREHTKLYNTYANKLPSKINEITGRIHCDFKQMGAKSGRIISSRPNLQNIPATDEYRSLFCAEPGHKFIIADYDQIELKILAQMSNDSKMLSAFNSGQDFHSSTAQAVFGTAENGYRKKAKAVNFGLVYGMSSYGLADRLGVSEDEAQGIIEKYFATFPQATQFLNDNATKAVNEHQAASLIGRRRIFKAATSYKEQASVQRLGRNHPIQATGADIMKLALIKLHTSFNGNGTKIVNTIHDEVVIETPTTQAEETASIVKKVMEDAGSDLLPDVPVTVDLKISDYWEK
jgi:DNA polymerase-1